MPVTLEDGYYEYTWPPPPHPSLEVKPSTYNATSLGEDVAVDIWVENVSEDWKIVGFQFVLAFNNTLLEPDHYEAGTFMEPFANDGESMLYVDGHDYLGDAALPPGYNAWTVTVMIMPDENGTWHAPFPEGEGLLVKLHFNATIETIYPDMAWTDLNFTELEGNPLNPYDDIGCYAIDVNINEVSFEQLIGGKYRAPVKDITPPEIIEVEQDPPADNVLGDQPVKVSANVTDYGLGVKNVTLIYTTDNWTTSNSVDMTFNTTTGLWEATLEGQDVGVTVKYMVKAYDYAGNYALDDNAGEYYIYTVIPEFMAPAFLIILLLATLSVAAVASKISKKFPK